MIWIVRKRRTEILVGGNRKGAGRTDGTGQQLDAGSEPVGQPEGFQKTDGPTRLLCPAPWSH